MPRDPAPDSDGPDFDDVAESFVRRLRSGEDVTVEAYAAEHPELADRIRQLFPVLAVMEGLKPPSPAAPPVVMPPAPRIPKQLGPFSVARELGRGGMGRVYEVHDRDGERRALKVVHPHLLQRPGFLARFLREVDTGLRVDHPGVVRTYASGVADYEGVEAPYLVLEYVEGGTLRALLDEAGPVSERLAREIGAAMADALAAIHAAGIVHRDVKPENVVIAPDETVKLMDLGVALVQEEALRLTQKGEFVGSLLYSAPEQVRSSVVDPRSDLYSLGLVLFELVAGRHPEAAEPREAVTRRLAARSVPRLREVVPAMTPFFEGVVATLLHPEPDARFAGAAAVAGILAAGEASPWWQEQERVRSRSDRPRRFEDAPRLRGRTTELALLDRLFESAAGGAGRGVVIVGDAGQGKSRLVSSWLDGCEAGSRAPAVLWLEHGPGAGSLGLTPLAHAVRRLLGADLDTRVRAWLGDQTEAAGALIRHVRAPEASEGHEALPRASLEGLYARLLRALAAERPLVFVIEDLHFASTEVRTWLERMVPTLAGDPVLVLVTARPGDTDAWIESTSRLEHVSILSLAGLSADDGARLFADALESDLGGLAAAQDVVRSADGNPFCLIEFAAQLREHARRPSLATQDVPTLPASVQQLVEERLAALAPEERDLLAVAACCGDAFDPVLVCEAAGVPRLAGLRLLHAADRTQRVIVAEGATYRFRHHLVQEGLHEDLPPALRGAYHTALAAARVARLGEGAPVSDAEAYAIARHFLLGDEPQRAGPFLEAGLAHLVGHAELRRADRMARRALAAFDDAEPGLRARLLLVRARALEGRALPAEGHAVAVEALAAAEQSGDDALLLEALGSRGLGGAVARMGRHDLSWPHAERAVAVAERLGDAALLADVLGDYAACLYDMGRHDEAFTTGQRAIELARSSGATAQSGAIIMSIAGMYSEAGHLDEAQQYAELALTTSHLHGDRATEQFALSILCRAALVTADLETAQDLSERHLANAREAGNLRQVSGGLLGLVNISLNRGEVAEAHEHAATCLDVVRTMGLLEMEALLAASRALLTMTVGDLGATQDILDSAQALLDQVPLGAIAARLAPRQANLCAWTGDFDQAEAYIAAGREKAAGAGARREALLTEQAAASLLDARGDPAGAAAAYAAVLDDLRAQGMRLYAALTAARLGGLLVRLGEDDAAREGLDEAWELGHDGPVAAALTETAAWRGLLPGGNVQHTRVQLGRPEGELPALARLRLWHELAERTGDEAARAEARALGERILATAPEDVRARMRAHVRLFRDAFEAPA